jgi:hypothetical protein
MDEMGGMGYEVELCGKRGTVSESLDSDWVLMPLGEGGGGHLQG